MENINYQTLDRIWIAFAINMNIFEFEYMICNILWFTEFDILFSNINIRA